MKKLFYFLSSMLLACSCGNYENVLLKDDFSSLDTGLFSAPVGPHTEYHYLPEAGKKGNWTVSSFASGGNWGTAWQVKQEEGKNVMVQTTVNMNRSTHPMIIAGDSLWTDYSLKVAFKPGNVDYSSGVAFRYHNDRCFYFFGVKDSSAFISSFRHAENMKSLKETILARIPFNFTAGEELTAEVTVKGRKIRAKINDLEMPEVTDGTWGKGKVGLVANSPAVYKSVEVLTDRGNVVMISAQNGLYKNETERFQAANPAMVVWKKVSTPGFGVGRNLRFGDLDGDGNKDVLIGQVVHHNWPRDSHSELSCLTAMTFDGKILWQKGTPDPEKDHLTNDTGFQIHDLDNNGKNEVIYCMNFEIIVADALSGQTLYKAPTPVSKIKDDKFSRILGDCLFFFDAEGKGWAADILIKDRYNNFWVMNNKLQVIWEGSCKTGHYPYSSDTDNDGKEELAIGYSLYDHDGKLLWCLDDSIADHADGVAVVNFRGVENGSPEIMYSASNAGYVRVDLKGNIIKHYYIGHVQNPAVADFLPEKPGLETVSINFWGNQGIQHFYDAEGNIYHDFEPNQFGSMCLPLNWTGKPGEFYVHNPNINEGGVFNGLGRKVMNFPDDGHPDMCNAVLDLTGDCRDEIVVWNPEEIWVYTQKDNPLQGRLYKPVRNALYNYSNYQATVSMPGWSE